MSVGQPGTSVPRDISKSVVSAGTVSNAAAAVIINPNPSRQQLLIGAGAQDIYITPIDPVSGVPVTTPAVGGIGTVKIAAGTFAVLGGGLASGGTTLGSIAIPCTSGFSAIANAAPSNLTAWEWA